MLKKSFVILLFSYISLFGFEHLNPLDMKEKLENKKVVIDFYATWCPPCKIVAQNLVEFDKIKPKDVFIYKVDVDEYKEIALDYGVQGLPTLAYFKNGKLVAKELGLRSVKQLSQDVKKYLEK
ncbi:MAG: thioredoxin family protein [Halarcobacter sp.]